MASTRRTDVEFSSISELSDHIVRVLCRQTKWKGRQVARSVVMETLQWKCYGWWLAASEAMLILSQAIHSTPQLMFFLLTLAVYRLKYWTVGLRSCPRGERPCMSAVLSSGRTSNSLELLRTLSPARACSNKEDLLLDICNSSWRNKLWLRHDVLVLDAVFAN